MHPRRLTSQRSDEKLSMKLFLSLLLLCTGAHTALAACCEFCTDEVARSLGVVPRWEWTPRGMLLDGAPTKRAPPPCCCAFVPGQSCAITRESC